MGVPDSWVFSRTCTSGITLSILGMLLSGKVSYSTPFLELCLPKIRQHRSDAITNSLHSHGPTSIKQGKEYFLNTSSILDLF